MFIYLVFHLLNPEHADLRRNMFVMSVINLIARRWLKNKIKQNSLKWPASLCIEIRIHTRDQWAKVLVPIHTGKETPPTRNNLLWYANVHWIWVTMETRFWQSEDHRPGLHRCIVELYYYFNIKYLSCFWPCFSGLNWNSQRAPTLWLSPQAKFSSQEGER